MCGAEPRWRADLDGVLVRRLLILDTAVRVLYPAILVLSLYLLFAGHNQPGGGFVGGLAAGAGVSLRYVAGGVDSVRRAFRPEPWTILGVGLCVSVTTAIFPLLLGHDVLEHATFEADLPGLGTVKATSALPFDIGVYLVVLGLALMMFEAFGEERDNEMSEIEPPATPAMRPIEAYRQPEPRPRWNGWGRFNGRGRSNGRERTS